MLYALFDGDNVGPRLERLLVQNRIQEARDFSLRITEAIELINELLSDRSDVEVLFSGGDDLLVQIASGPRVGALLQEICATFYRCTGNTMSCGVGADTRQAIWSLHLAKLFGKNQIRGL